MQKKPIIQNEDSYKCYSSEQVETEKIDKKIQDVLKCCICYGFIKKNLQCHSCTNIFGKECIKEWLLSSSSKNKCPQCRKPINYYNLQPSNVVQSLIDTLILVKCKNWALGCTFSCTSQKIQKHLEDDCKFEKTELHQKQELDLIKNDQKQTLEDEEPQPKKQNHSDTNDNNTNDKNLNYIERKYTFHNGDKVVGVIGKCLNEEMTGEGKIIFNTKDEYEGELLKGKMNGKGLYYFDKGDKYKGEFLDGKRIGEGIYYFKNGDKYEGQYLNGEMNGKGKYYYNINRKESYFEGIFQMGKRVGQGLMKFKDGSEQIMNYDDQSNQSIIKS